MAAGHIAYGSLDMLRACAAECLHMSAFYAGMGADYALAEDDAGLDYSTRKSVAALKQAVGILAMLKEQKEREAARREVSHAA